MNYENSIAFDVKLSHEPFQVLSLIQETKMSPKLELMKKELAEVNAALVEWSSESTRLQNEAQERYNRGLRNSHDDAVKICEMQMKREAERALLLSRHYDLQQRIRIREEALDLLKEAGLVNERGKEVSPVPQMALTCILAAIIYHFLENKTASQNNFLPLPQPD